MARPIKTGIDYYPLNVDFLQDVKVRKIMRACGTQSIAILISLLSSIYKDEGYYVVWDSDMSFLVADEVGASEGAVLEIVNKAVQVDFFNEELFKKYKIITSRGIQKRFMEAVSRRRNIDVIKEYLLVNVNNNMVNVNINSINDSRSTQRKEKERKEKESKELLDNCSSSFAEIGTLYQQVIGQPNGLTPQWIEVVLKEYGLEWVKNAMLEAEKRGKRTKKYVEGILQNWKAGGGMKLRSDFDKRASGFKDNNKKSFDNFNKREYDPESLKQNLLAKSRGDIIAGSND